MDPSAFFKELRELHAKAKTRSLTAEERPTYEKMRDTFAQAIMAAQGMLRGDNSKRRTVRVAAMLPLQLTVSGKTFRVATVDLSVGGFGAIVEPPPPIGSIVDFTLSMNGTKMSGKARVVAGVVDPKSSSRASFAFETLSGAELELIDQYVMDTALARVAT